MQRIKQALPASVQKFNNAAAACGFEAAIVVKPEPARTAEDAARACGCDVAEIVKSLVFRGVATGEPLLFLVSGRNRVDEAAAAILAGEAISRPDAAFVRQVTGYAIGGIPPFGHDTPCKTFLDAALLGFPRVWAAAGHPNAVFPIAPERLRDATAARVVDLG